MGHMCPRFHGGDFFTPSSLGPSVLETKDFTSKQPLLGEVILPVSSLNLLLSLLLLLLSSLLFVCPYFCIFTRFVVFCLLVSPFLSFFFFLFQMCSSRRCGANSLLHSLIISSHWLAASSKQCLLQKRKAPFVLIWLVLSAASFGLRLTVFPTCLPIRFMLRPTYSA